VLTASAAVTRKTFNMTGSPTTNRTAKGFRHSVGAGRDCGTRSRPGDNPEAQTAVDREELFLSRHAEIADRLRSFIEAEEEVRKSAPAEIPGGPVGEILFRKGSRI
jgi:hypothetical protein